MAGPDASDVSRPAITAPWPGWRTWLLLALVLLVVAGIRVRFAAVPLERDEGEYAVFGRLILQGQVPYVAAYNMKLPGVYYAYALFLAVFGEWDVGLRLGALLVCSISAILVFLLGRRIGGDRVGLVAALSYGLFSTSSRTVGFTANTEHFVVVFVLAGLWVLSGAGGLWRARRLILAGFLFGLAVLMKQHAAFFGAFAAGWIALGEGAPTSLRSRLRRLGAFALGLITPYALTCLYFAGEGAFSQFWFWTVTYAREYTQQSTWLQGLMELFGSGIPLAVWQWPTVLLALRGLAAREGTAAPWRAWLRTLLAVGFLSTCPGLLFRNHYFLLMAPALALLAGVGADAFLAGTTVGRTARGTVLLLLAMAASNLVLDGPLLLSSSRDVSQRLYATNAFPEMKDVAEFLREHTLPDEPIAVLGSEPQIYFYAHRPAATGYIYTYPLMEIHPHALSMQQEMIRELETRNPRYFVLVQIPHSWLMRPDSVRELPTWIDQSLLPRCRTVGLVEIFTENGFDYESRAVWGPVAAQRQPEAPFHIRVLERVDRR